MKVHLLNDDREFLRFLQNNVTGISITAGTVRDGVPEFDVLVGGRPDRAALEYSPQLRLLLIPFAGVPEETRTLMMDFPDIPVHNLHHNARPTAELALALLFAASKNLLPDDQALRTSDWTPRYEGNPGILLEERRVCILGFGAVGREIAQLCKALGMEVTGIRARALPGESWQGIPVRPSAELEEVLKWAQILFLAVPLTGMTRGLIGSHELELLRKPSVLVNIARGPVVEERALYDALRDGTLTAAGLDVWYRYPAGRDERTKTWPSDCPFQDLSNVVMSPHRGGSSDRTEELRARELARLLTAASRGEELWNMVDLSRGY